MPRAMNASKKKAKEASALSKCRPLSKRSIAKAPMSVRRKTSVASSSEALAPMGDVGSPLPPPTQSRRSEHVGQGDSVAYLQVVKAVLADDLSTHKSFLLILRDYQSGRSVTPFASLTR